ncbi:ATP-binding protein [Sulfitobacter sp. M39]|uniref:ATP-binding protein n=1 Tax=Sulfitobacter sp. M39 TaxID=2675334 RepID=UPI001F21E485|nr:ATP-binding protein [Sulfitobacter sp. M39]MCF7746182.1 ATP-binding protein [Sulfitobacter sp. M39]
MSAPNRNEGTVGQADTPYGFEVTSEASADAVRAALGHIRDELADRGLSQENLEIVELVLAETLNNVVEHAYAGLPQAGLIGVRGAYAPDDLRFRITDLGKPMPGFTLPMGEPFNVLDITDDLPEGGFGWGLIRLLSCELEYSRMGDMNLLALRVPLAAG